MHRYFFALSVVFCTLNASGCGGPSEPTVAEDGDSIAAYIEAHPEMEFDTSDQEGPQVRDRE